MTQQDAPETKGLHKFHRDGFPERGGCIWPICSIYMYS